MCRYGYDNELTDRDLVEYYLPAWNAVVTRGKALGFMCAYTAVNGVPACASEWAMQELMVEQWGFDGYVVSDCLALQVMMQAHEYIPYDIPLAAALSLKAGVSYNCGCVLKNGTEEAIARGLVNESVVNENVRRTLSVLMRLGEFDADVPYRAYGAERLDSAANRALALDAALQGMVLLRNEGGLLPLSASAKLAFIGPAAGECAPERAAAHARSQTRTPGTCSIANAHSRAPYAYPHRASRLPALSPHRQRRNDGVQLRR